MNSLNSEQQIAVDSNASHILCLAGAGTGKSFTLLSRIARLVKSGVDPRSILALTFTNAAAAEMRHRYKQHCKDQRIPEFRTFHSFCYHLLAIDKAVRNQLGYVDLPAIASESKMRQLELSVKAKCGITLTDSQIANPSKLAMKDKFQYDLYMKAKNKELRIQNIITFDMLCYNICALFTENSPIVEKYKNRYTYIFVDEFQDTDPKQYDFVKSFANANLFVVGDALQNIYSFRGSDSSIIKSLSCDADWQTIKLYQNYRSTSEICNFANSVSTYADLNYRIEIQSEHSGDAVEERVSSTNMYAEIAEIAQNCKGTLAVLARTNSEVSEICAYLSSKGIVFDTSSKPIDYQNILMSAIDIDHMYSWLSTLLDKQSAIELLRVVSISCAEDEKFDKLNYLLTTYKYKPAIRSNYKLIEDVKSVLLDEKLLPFQKCTDILNMFKIRNVIVDTTATQPADLVEYLNDVIDSTETSFVYVGTIHSSKGLEYDTVVLTGVDGDTFKLRGEDNLNLYYVGITRAKNRLIIYKY